MMEPTLKPGTKMPISLEDLVTPWIDHIVIVDFHDGPKKVKMKILSVADGKAELMVVSDASAAGT